MEEITLIRQLIPEKTNNIKIAEYYSMRAIKIHYRDSKGFATETLQEQCDHCINQMYVSIAGEIRSFLKNKLIYVDSINEFLAIICPLSKKVVYSTYKPRAFPRCILYKKRVLFLEQYAKHHYL